MNIHYVGVTSDVIHAVCFALTFVLHSRSCCPCTICVSITYCANQVVNMALQQCHTLLHVVYLAIKGILISTAIVSPCQELVALLSSIAGYTEKDGGHSITIVLFCFYKFDYKNAFKPNA